MKYLIAIVLSLSLLACGSVKSIPEVPQVPHDTTVLVKVEVQKVLDTAVMQSVLSQMLNLLDSSYTLFIRDYYISKDSVLLAQAGWEHTRDSLAADFKKKLKTSLKGCETVKTIVIYRPDSTLVTTNQALLDSIQVLNQINRVTTDEKGTVEFSEGVHKTANWILGILFILFGLYTAFFIKRKK